MKWLGYSTSQLTKKRAFILPCEVIQESILKSYILRRNLRGAFLAARPLTHTSRDNKTNLGVMGHDPSEKKRKNEKKRNGLLTRTTWFPPALGELDFLRCWESSVTFGVRRENEGFSFWCRASPWCRARLSQSPSCRDTRVSRPASKLTL